MTTVDVELARPADGPDLRAALAAHGLASELVDGHVLVSGAGSRDVGHALEAWLWGRGLPLVPVRLDDAHYVLAPPAA